MSPGVADNLGRRGQPRSSFCFHRIGAAVCLCLLGYQPDDLGNDVTPRHHRADEQSLLHPRGWRYWPWSSLGGMGFHAREGPIYKRRSPESYHHRSACLLIRGSMSLRISGTAHPGLTPRPFDEYRR
jgi:hypothetical protein